MSLEKFIFCDSLNEFLIVMFVLPNISFIVHNRPSYNEKESADSTV